MMIKKLLLLPLLLVLTSMVAYGQLSVKCPPPTFKTPSHQYRGDVKHRTRRAETGTSITVAEIYALPDVDADTVNSDTNASRPMPSSAETRTFTLDAFLRQATVEGNDCEIHLEFADTKRVDARRVIVEVPPDADFRSDYQRILRLMKARFPGRKGLGPGVKFALLPPVRMKITGLGFFDGFHKRMVGPKNPNGSHGSPHVMTFWELHPAWNIQCARTDCP